MRYHTSHMKGRRLRWSLVCAAAMVAAVVALAFVPPPRFVLRVIVERSSGWLMAGDGGRLEGLVRAYVYTALAAHIGDPLLEEPRHDEEILLRMMTEVRKSVISASGKPTYSPAHWPALIAGVGYCDQINGAVCSLAARYFPKAELIGLYDPVKLKSPHTIGRVWSEERGEWLYFDAFYREPVVFTRDADGQPRFVRLPESTSTISRREVAPAGVYALEGWTFAEFPRTFGMYVVNRVRARLMHVPDAAGVPPPQQETAQQQMAQRQTAQRQTAQPQTAQRQTATQPSAQQTSVHDSDAAPVHQGILAGRPFLKPSSPLPKPSKINEDLYRRVVRAYAKARVLHLLGEPDRNAYRVVAGSANTNSDDRASEIVATARRFVERPEL